MVPYLSEFLGTMMLVALGTGVCAAQNLDGSFFKNSGAVFTILGWGLAVMLPAMAFGVQSGAHFNPVLTVALAVAGSFEWNLVAGYILAQMLGGFLGACFVFLVYKDHFALTLENGATKEDLRGVFCCSPSIPNPGMNILGEAAATFFLIFFIMSIPQSAADSGLNYLFVYCTVMACGFSFGATTGFAMNPARDTAPRLAYRLLIKGNADWGYGWIPIVGPFIGGLAGGWLAKVVTGWL